jgi:hypothetical protein
MRATNESSDIAVKLRARQPRDTTAIHASRLPLHRLTSIESVIVFASVPCPRLPVPHCSCLPRPGKTWRGASRQGVHLEFAAIATRLARRVVVGVRFVWIGIPLAIPPSRHSRQHVLVPQLKPQPLLRAARMVRYLVSIQESMSTSTSRAASIHRHCRALCHRPKIFRCPAKREDHLHV